MWTSRLEWQDAITSLPQIDEDASYIPYDFHSIEVLVRTTKGRTACAYCRTERDEDEPDITTWYYVGRDSYTFDDGEVLLWSYMPTLYRDGVEI